MTEKKLQAAMLIIGNEILSGRTQDCNLQELAKQLKPRGIKVIEVKIVRDEKPALIDALNYLRYTYAVVFTSGGIGPTHDDITTACVAEAFGVKVIRHKKAEADLKQYYIDNNREPNEARLSMANIPEGAKLVYSDTTPAPGFHIGNVYVFAGVPHIFKGMVAAVLDDLAQGLAVLSKTITVHVGESEVAFDLQKVQDNFSQLELGSYPQEKDGSYFTELVISGNNQNLIDQAVFELTNLLDARSIPWSTKD